MWILMILVILGAFLIQFGILAVFLEAKLEWTKDKKLVLWYSECRKENIKERKVIVLFKI